MTSAAATDPSPDFARHTEEVDALWIAYSRRENERVPLFFACDEQLWLKVAGETFGRFYADPRVHLRAQLEGKRWFADNVIGDMRPGPPNTWNIGVQLWMHENEFFGCEVVYQADDYAWGLPLDLPREDLLQHLADLDPVERVRRNSAFRMWEALRELADGLQFDGRPVHVVAPGGGTHGILTKAAEIRGPERLCLDLYEAPDFVNELLRLVTERTLDRLRAWHKLATGGELNLPMWEGFHFADDSLQLISPSCYERFVLPHHERLYSAMTTGPRGMHLCGHSAQHFELLYHRLNVTILDGPGPFVDHAHYLREFGPDFTLQAQLDHSILERGTAADIDRMMRDLLRPGCRLPGRFQVMGFLTRHTPLRNVRACYESALTHGRI